MRLIRILTYKKNFKLGKRKEQKQNKTLLIKIENLKLILMF